MYLAIAILFLNITDAAFTAIGIHFGLIEEGNPWMNHFIHKDLFSFFVIKIGLPMILILITVFLKKKWFFSLMKAVVVLYLFVLAVHLVWVIPYFIQ